MTYFIVFNFYHPVQTKPPTKNHHSRQAATSETEK